MSTRPTQSIAEHNVLLVLGDFNVHVGAKDARYAYHSETNKNRLNRLHFDQQELEELQK